MSCAITVHTIMENVMQFGLYNKVWLEDAAPPRITVTSHHCMHICTAQAYVKIIMRFLISALQHISDEEQPDYLNLANKHRTH